MSITSPLKASSIGTVEFDSAKGIYYEKMKQSKNLTTAELAKLPLLQQINWLSTTIIFFPIVVTVLGYFFVPLRLNTFLWTLVIYFCTGISITGGYHRLWSHKSYEAHWSVHLFFALWGAGAFEGSARWWSRLHRAHHRYIDTEHDPYATHHGFWHAHWGWMVFKQDASLQGKVDISDLNNNSVVVFQHVHYLRLALFFGLGLPILVAGLFWGDWLGGFVYASCARMVFVHTATFFINSLAHTIGRQTYSTRHSSYDSIITAITTLGEGYHNYHHEFPMDYRNGVCWYQYDPTKWIVWAFSWTGLVWSLVRTPQNEIIKARIQVQQEEIDKISKKLDWGRDVSTLPSWTWKDIEDKTAKEGQTLLVVDGVVIDVTKFKHEHPGGRQIVTFWSGRDATEVFNGSVYNHSKAARNLIAFYQVAKLVDNGTAKPK